LVASRTGKPRLNDSLADAAARYRRRLVRIGDRRYRYGFFDVAIEGHTYLLFWGPRHRLGVYQTIEDLTADIEALYGLFAQQFETPSFFWTEHLLRTAGGAVLGTRYPLTAIPVSKVLLGYGLARLQMQRALVYTVDHRNVRLTLGPATAATPDSERVWVPAPDGGGSYYGTFKLDIARENGRRFRRRKIRLPAGGDC
jgi:hypothetical protein